MNKGKTMKDIKEKILNQFKCQDTDTFNPMNVINERVDYLKNKLLQTNAKGYVLGISGGVDSLVVGKLCQMAVNELNAAGYQCAFHALRLPSGIQMDESHAQAVLNFIDPTYIKTINIGDSVWELNEQIVQSCYPDNISANVVDFNKGNLKARMRMAAQYYIASLYNCLVIGTDHNAEAVMGFYTKWGDGACDLIVLNGLNKRQVRLIAKRLGADKLLYDKPATADLEELNPQKLDEDALGVPYEYIDDFLEGKPIPDNFNTLIINQYLKTEHKRNNIIQFQ